LRDGAEVARWAHNPKVGGSNPPPATTKNLNLLLISQLTIGFLIFGRFGLPAAYCVVISMAISAIICQTISNIKVTVNIST